MPITRQRLSKSEIAMHRDRAERMLAAGVDIQIREEWREPARGRDTLDIAVAEGCASFAFDLTAARAGYVVSVRLVGRALGAILNCRLTTPWDHDIVPASFSDFGNSMCRLGPLQYPRYQVLNMRITNSMRFAPGQLIEGVILATGVNPIPEAYRHGQIVPVDLLFLDQNKKVIRETPEILVDRSWITERKSMVRRSGLYDRGKIVPTSASFPSRDPSDLEGEAPRRRAAEGKNLKTE